MSALIADERWQTYAQHIESMIANAERARDAYNLQLQNMLLSRDDYVKVKINQARHTALAEAYHNSLEIVQVLIESGAKAAEELTARLTKE